jgi:dimeric dUTPase (all-alpha-NTP-PPase superfamily)
VKSVTNHDDLIQTNLELSQTVAELADEVESLKAIIASKQWNATEFEQDYILHEYQSVVAQNRLLMIEIQSLKDSRDMYQNRNDILTRDLNSLKRKLKT